MRFLGVGKLIFEGKNLNEIFIFTKNIFECLLNLLDLTRWYFQSIPLDPLRTTRSCMRRNSTCGWARFLLKGTCT